MSYTLQNQTPVNGKITWSDVHIVYDGQGYAVADGNTANKYVFWLLSDPLVLQTSATYPVLGEEDCIVFLNNGGIGTSVLDATVINGALIVPGTIHASALVAGSIAADQIGANAVTAEKIAADSITGEKVAANTITADKIDSKGLTIKDDAGNVIFGAGQNLDVSRISGLQTAIDASMPVTVILSNEAHTLPADQAGVVGSFAGASTTVTVYHGESNDTANWTISKADTSVTSTLNQTTKTVTVTAISADVGYVDITATHATLGSITKRFVLTKAKSGSVGADGSSATAYWLVRSAGAIQQSTGGTFTPGTITFSAYAATGTNAPAAYAARFIIATTTDGVNFTNQYTSASNEASKTYTLPAGIKAVRCRLYLAGGVSTLLDEELTPVVFDGAAGAAGSSGTRGSRTYYLSGYTAWSSTAATTAASESGGPIHRDIVTEYGTNFSQTRYYDAGTSTWNTITAAIDGNLLVSGSVVADKIDSRNLSIKDASGNVILATGTPLGGTYIADAAITNAKIQDATISGAKIADAAISSAKIADAAISSAKIADAAISSAKIQDAAISSVKIQDAAISSAKIGSAQVDTLHIAGNAVTIPVTAYTSGQVTNSGTFAVQSAYIDAGGAPVIAMGCAVISIPSGTATLQLLAPSGTVIGQGRCSGSTSSVAVSGSSTEVGTYSLVAIGTSTTVSLRSLALLGAKR